MTLLAQRGELVDHEDLNFLFTPKGTRTWKPIPHVVLLNEVQERVEASGLKIAKEQHALSKNKKKYFGVLYTGSLNGSSWTFSDGCRLAIGIRNSHDKSLSAAIGLGSEVLVCSNLAFSAEVVLKRKHTRFIERDLPGLIGGAMERLQKESVTQAEDFERFRKTGIWRYSQISQVLLSLYRQGVLSSTMLGPVFDEVGKRAKNVWNLYNACTRQLNLKISGLEMSRRSVRLHNYCTNLCKTGAIWGEQEKDGTED